MTDAANVRPRGPGGREHRREFLWFGGSTIVYQGSRFAFSLAAARSLNAADFTAWALVVALLAYAPAVLLGVSNGMSRELPILSGRGELRSMDRVLSATWVATGIALAALAVIAGVVALALPAVGTEVALVALLAGGTIVFGIQQFVLRSRLRFDAASLQLAVFGAAAIAVAVLLAFSADAGLAFAATLYGVPLMAGIATGIAVERPAISLPASAAVAMRLAGIGFPIMLAGLVFSLFVTLDRWTAALLLGAERAAPYTLASLLAAALLVVPTVVSQQTYPRMAVARGEGADAVALRAMARQQGVRAGGLVLPIAAAVVGFAFIGIPAWLPAYRDATGAVVALSIGFAALAAFTGYGNYLNVVGAQWRYLAAQVAGVVAAVPLMVAGGASFGLTGIGIAMAASHVLYGALLFMVARRTPIMDRLA